MYREQFIKAMIAVLIIGVIYYNMEKKANIEKEARENNSYSYSQKYSNKKSYYNKDETKLIIKTYVEDIIKSNLKFPSSAKFPTLKEWEIIQNSNRYSISSYVEAENSLGVTTTTYFCLLVTIKDGEMSYKDLEIYE